MRRSLRGRPFTRQRLFNVLELEKIRTCPRSERGELVRILPVLYVILMQIHTGKSTSDAPKLFSAAPAKSKPVQITALNRFSWESSLFLYVPVGQLFLSNALGVSGRGHRHGELGCCRVSFQTARSATCRRKSAGTGAHVSRRPAVPHRSALNFACHQPVISGTGRPLARDGTHHFNRPP